MTLVAVACSGGRDSTALLHCTVKLASTVGLQVLALHVHHGLQPEADEWLKRVRAQARRWGVRFESRRLQGLPAAGDSIEAWARRERYAALSDMAHRAGCDLVQLAHHRRDQAETFLLQALRAGGAAGHSAMPRTAQRHGITWARPWLDHPRSAIDDYVKRHRLRPADDPSNANRRYARNRLRVDVWPSLLAAFPDAETALAGAARQAQQSAGLAAEALALDLPVVADAAGLRVSDWLTLPEHRRRNALQGWLANGLPNGVPGALVDRLMQEVRPRAEGRWIAQTADIRLYRDRLMWVEATLHAESEGALEAMRLDLSQPGRYPVPRWHGAWVVEAARSAGVLPALLIGAKMAGRRGGERIRLNASGPLRSLKKQYQSRAVPAWQRGGPVLWTAADEVLWVPGLNFDASMLAAQGQAQLSLRWEPDALQPTGQRQHVR